MAKRVTATGPVEGPWALPDGWRWKRLGDLANRIADKHVPDSNSALPFVGMDAIAPNSMKATAGQPFSEMRSAASAFQEGDVLYGRLRPYLNKVWYATYAGACSGELIVIRPSIEIEARYLAFLLHSDAFVRFASHAVSGDRPRIDFGTMGDYPVPVPPVDIQRRTVARIDELFAEIDDGEAALARARDDLAIWRKALLKAAVTGELTADWRAANPPTETGAELLAHIVVNRRDRWDADAKNKGRRYVEPSAAEAGLPTLPNGWAWSSMGQLLDRIEAGLNVKCVERPPHGAETGLLKISAVTWWRFNERASKTLADSHVHPDQWLIANGDLLVSRANTLELVGAPAVVEGLSLRLMLSDKVLRLAMPAYLRRWTFYVMRSPYGRAWIEGHSTGNQLSMRNISQDALRAMPLPLPPRTELDHIVALLDVASWQHETTANDVGIFDAAAATLRQSILAAAFRGDLA